MCNWMCRNKCSYLPNKFLIHGNIALGPVQGLLQESEQDGDDDGCFEGLAEDDEEYGDGEDVGRHWGYWGGWQAREI